MTGGHLTRECVSITRVFLIAAFLLSCGSKSDSDLPQRQPPAFALNSSQVTGKIRGIEWKSLGAKVRPKRNHESETLMVEFLPFANENPCEYSASPNEYDSVYAFFPRKLGPSSSPRDSEPGELSISFSHYQRAGNSVSSNGAIGFGDLKIEELTSTSIKGHAEFAGFDSGANQVKGPFELSICP